MTTFHQILPPNQVGRDFVVGDLHGCLDLLESELGQLQFDEQRDRLLSVGDLADRGPDSLGCLRLLRKPWFFPVRGNHEEMLLSYFLRDSSYHSQREFLINGGEWVMHLADAELEELRTDLLPRIQDLPYVITVENGNDTFHVAHAELTLADNDLTECRLSHMAIELTWSRRLIRRVNLNTAAKQQTVFGTLAKSHEPWESGMALRFVGHTPLPMLVMHRSHLFIDGGAFMREPHTGLQVLEVAEIFSALL